MRSAGRLRIIGPHSDLREFETKRSRCRVAFSTLQLSPHQNLCGVDQNMLKDSEDNDTDSSSSHEHNVLEDCSFSRQWVSIVGSAAESKDGDNYDCESSNGTGKK